MPSKNVYDTTRLTMRALVGEYRSIDAFAQATGLAKPAIYNYLSGRCMPRLDAAVEICRRRRVSLDWLVGLSDDPGRPISVAPKLNRHERRVF